VLRRQAALKRLMARLGARGLGRWALKGGLALGTDQWPLGRAWSHRTGICKSEAGYTKKSVRS
jgi:hypothetical protein